MMRRINLLALMLLCLPVRAQVTTGMIRNGAVTGPKLAANAATGLNVTINADAYTTSTVYTHARGLDELAGDTAQYPAAGCYGIALYEQVSGDTTFNAVRCQVWCANTTRDVTLKVFVLSFAAGFNLTTTTPDYQGTISHLDIPHAAGTPKTYYLDKSITASAGKYVYIVFESSAENEIGVQKWSALSSNPARHTMGRIDSSEVLWADVYYAPSFVLYNRTNVARTPTTVFTPPGGAGAVAGDATYTSGAITLLGYYEQMSQDTTFKTVTCCRSGSRLADLQMMVFERSSPNAFNPATVTALWSGTIPGPSVPTSATAQTTFVLDRDVTCRAGYYLFVLFYQNSGANAMRRWSSGTSPAGGSAHGFVYSTALNATFGFSSMPSLPQAGFLLGGYTATPAPLSTVLPVLPAKGVSFDPTRTGMTSTNTQDAIVEAYNHAVAPTILASSVSYTNTASGLTGVNAQDAIDQLARDFASRIILPDDITAVVGDKLQVFTRGVIESMNPYAQPYKFVATVGSSYPRYFEYTPVLGDVGMKTLTVTQMDKTGATKATATTNIIVVNPAGAPASTKRILCLGDSLTAGGVWPAEAYRRLTQAGGSPAGLSYGNIDFIGHEKMLDYTGYYSGFGGWTWLDWIGGGGRAAYRLTATHDKDRTDIGSVFTQGGNTFILVDCESGSLKVWRTAGSGAPTASGTLTYSSGGAHATDIVYTASVTEDATPLWKRSTGAISFSDFVTRYSMGGLDAVYVLLGWNQITAGQFTGASNSTIAGYVRTFLTQLHADYPSAVVRVMGLPVPSPTGGLGANYGATGVLSSYYDTLKVANGVNAAYQAVCDEPTYSGFCRYVSLGAQFDAEYNYPSASVAVNSRSATTETRGTNGIHPANEGYYQIADAVWRDIIRTFCSS